MVLLWKSQQSCMYLRGRGRQTRQMRRQSGDVKLGVAWTCLALLERVRGSLYGDAVPGEIMYEGSGRSFPSKYQRYGHDRVHHSGRSSIKSNKIHTIGMFTTDSKALAIAHEQSSPCLPIHCQTVLRILMPRCDVAPSGVLRERWKHVRGVTQAYFQGSSACTTPMATLELYLPTAAIKPAVLLGPLPFFTLRISIS